MKRHEEICLINMTTEPFHPKHFPVGSVHTFVGHRLNEPEQLDTKNKSVKKLLNTEVEILGYGPNDNGAPMYVAKTVVGIQFIFGYELGQ